MPLIDTDTLEVIPAKNKRILVSVDKRFTGRGETKEFPIEKELTVTELIEALREVGVYLEATTAYLVHERGTYKTQEYIPNIKI